MKYAFYTANRNNLTWKEAITTAKDLGFSGIEIGAGLLDAQPFTSQYILRTAEQLANLNLEISCFSSSCSLNDREKKKRKHTATERAHRYCSQDGCFICTTAA